MARKETQTQKNVLITGCSSGGIGSALLNSFRNRGHKVFATVRNFKNHYSQNPNNASDLPAGVTWLPLDVTDQTAIDKCVVLFKELSGGESLDILVNNAGVGYSMPLLDSDMEQARKVFDVNYFGVLAVTQAFAPMLIESKGRIVNISSVAQFTPVPWLGVYNSSKAALGMLSDTLRLELSPFGVKVINVITGGVKSNMNDNNVKGVIGPDSVYHPGKEVIKRMIGGETSLKYQSDQNAYAEKVVKHVLSSSPSAQLYAGDKSTSLWLVKTFTWHTIWDWIFPRISGITTLKRNIEQKARAERSEGTP